MINALKQLKLQVIKRILKEIFSNVKKRGIH